MVAGSALADDHSNSGVDAVIGAGMFGTPVSPVEVAGLVEEDQ